MKKPKQLILALLLVAASAMALAGWVEIERFDDGMRVFVEPATVRRSGATAEVVHLVRWGEPQLEPGYPPYLSTIVRTAYDCAGKGEKYLASTSYAGAMGNGARVVEDDNAVEDWYSISEASLEEKLWKIACGVK